MTQAEGDAPLSPALARLQAATGWVAVAGGLLALGVAALAVASILGRWLLGQPIGGDFEYVKMATAVAVFAYLPYTQARGGNIIVDTFTRHLPASVTAALDAFWSLVYTAVLGFGTVALVRGTLDSIRSGETTMMAQVPLWPSIAVATALCALTFGAAAITTLLHLRGRGPGLRS